MASSTDPLIKSLISGWPRRKSLLSQVLRSWRSSSDPLSKGEGSKTAALAAVLAWVFDNGRIMIPLEQMGGHSPSAAERLVANGLKTDHNSLAGKELNWWKKVTSMRVSLHVRFSGLCEKIASAMQSIQCFCSIQGNRPQR
jgi:hypothetical protein